MIFLKGWIQSQIRGGVFRAGAINELLKGHTYFVIVLISSRWHKCTRLAYFFTRFFLLFLHCVGSLGGLAKRDKA